MVRRGAYALILELRTEATVTVGRLGTFVFPAGRYAYVGSAMSGLDARVARHLRAEKRRRWHVDYLLAAAEVVEVIEFESDVRQECGLSRAVSRLPGASVPVTGFGSSDCRCRSHLYRLGVEPVSWVSLAQGIAEERT